MPPGRVQSRCEAPNHGKRGMHAQRFPRSHGAAALALRQAYPGLADSDSRHAPQATYSEKFPRHLFLNFLSFFPPHARCTSNRFPVAARGHKATSKQLSPSPKATTQDDPQTRDTDDSDGLATATTIALTVAGFATAHDRPLHSESVT